MNKTKAFVLFLGLGIFVYIFQEIGIQDIWSRLVVLGWKAPLVFIPFFIVNFVNTWAWIRTFTPPFSKYGISFNFVFWVRIFGESVNNFTPTAHIGGEFTRVYCLKKSGLSSTTSFVSVIMDKAALVISEIIFICMGIFLLLVIADLSFWQKFLAGVSFVLAFVVILGILLAVKRGFLSRISGGLIKKLKWPWLIEANNKIRHLDNHLSKFYQNHPREFVSSNLWHLTGWVMGAMETWTILYLLGFPVGIVEALMIESLTTLIKGIGMFIPGSLGVLEGGSVLMFLMLDMTQGLGLTFSLLKRTREIFYGGLGWLVISFFYSLKKPLVSQSISS